MKKIKYIIFDVMGVVFKVGDDTNDLLIPFILSMKKDVSKETILSLYKDASLGAISARDFWLALGFAANEIMNIQNQYLETCLTLDEEFVECVMQLKKKYKIALLSNDVSEWSAYLRKIHDIDQYIDFSFISSDLGLRKPDPEIYKAALREMKAHPSECIFIDDDPERVEAAARLGITAILFNREGHGYDGIQILSFSGLVERLI
ncbi:MAG: HAD family phosphatase [Betaproteobacteria bacterium]|nr:HAD family phosphatase [Betaproteobacteria bacterium]